MKENNIFINDWLELHPYMIQQESDLFFVKLSNELYKAINIKGLPSVIKKRCALYIAAYLEDIISGLGLWHTFIKENEKLYSKFLPFYEITDDYIDGEINEEDIRFLLWYTLYKAEYTPFPTNPLSNDIKESAEGMFKILEGVYETAPANEELKYFFYDFKNAEDAQDKIDWLFRSSYLIQPSTSPFEVADDDMFIFPCGPLALFIYEWLKILSGTNFDKWKEINELIPHTPEFSKEIKDKNRETYKLFTNGNNGNSIVYLDGYESLKNFLVNVLKWPDNESHTLPQMKEFSNFILMTEEEKGILLAHSIAPCIKDPLNPLYNHDIAKKEAFSLLTEFRKCPPDLLHYILDNKYLPDAQFPEYGERELVENNADFIARCSLLYFYRGD